MDACVLFFLFCTARTANCSSPSPAGGVERAANRRQQRRRRQQQRQEPRTEALMERSCRTTLTDRPSVLMESVVADEDVVAGLDCGSKDQLKDLLLLGGEIPTS
uniref:Secreted protein n=1 Tax=Anopheles coluzzii TaxID=1518534 RepID=A0A8W7P4H4_ANOCL